VVTYDAAVDASYTATQYQALVSSVAAAGANTSVSLIAAALKQKRNAVVSLGHIASDLTAPQDLVCAALFAHQSLRSSGVLGSAALAVVHDVSTIADGKVYGSTARGAPSSKYVAGLDSLVFWNHIQLMESIPYPS
jgi:hypothetical protein